MRFALLGTLLLFAASCSSGGGETVDPPLDAGMDTSDVAGGLDVLLPPEDTGAPDIPEGDIVPDQVQLPGCQTDDDCGRFERCLPGYDGRACLPECLVQDSCPPGYFCKATSLESDSVLFVCLPDLPQLCLPCAEDAQCGGGVCVDVDGQRRCATTCTAASGCPDGYDCGEIGVADPERPDEGLCLPRSGSCDCTAATEGQKRPCTREGDAGSCQGFEVCDPTNGWSDCDAPAPEAEQCDGVDNDCDGAIDEALPESQPCERTEEGVGTCAGSATCGGQLGWVCDAPTPSGERCDYLDNDCDGETDEDFVVDGAYVHEEHCGACNIACEGTIANGTAFCDSSLGDPLCAVLTCDDGFYPVGRFQCLPTAVEHCRPCSSDLHCGGGICLGGATARFCTEECVADGDCPDGYGCVARSNPDGTPLGSFCLPPNGSCDCGPANAGEERACTYENEFGVCFGTETCDPELGWQGCDAQAPLPETCDGADEDCDGVPDDDLPVDQLCEVEVPGVGICPGRSLCFGALGWVCDAPAPEAERCDDWDNDCDGETDEDFKQDGAYTLVEHCGGCGNDCRTRMPNATTACVLGDDGAPRCEILACAPGFYRVADDLCLQISTVLCAPCASDDDCRGGRCVADEAGQRFCSRPCDEGVCPDGYACDTVDGEGGGESEAMCLPASGDCLCARGDAGLTRPCFVTTDAGTCYGQETCDPDGGWEGCTAPTPDAETCNGTDDDCDGLVDEELAPEGCEESNEFGVCSGERMCADGAWLCTARVPAEETCNYLDDDCDGVVDGPFKDGDVYATDDHCGGCGNSCEGAIPNGTAACSVVGAAAVCAVVACDEGFVQLDAFACVARPAVLCLPCQGDDDCVGGVCHDDGEGGYCATSCAAETCPAGYRCEDVAGRGPICLPTSGSCDCTPARDGAQRWCQTENTLGACDGLSTCNAGPGQEDGWGACDAPAPAEEVCDGADNDCDGFVDEDTDAVEPCERSNEHGVCVGEARCLGAAGVVCDAATPAAEVCDRLDNDCDGEIDEDFRTDGLYLSDDHCGACGHACDGAVPNGTASCQLTGAGTPACLVASCDEGFVQAGDLACIRPPNTSCRPCDSDSDCFGAACVNMDGQQFCLRSCVENADCPGGYQCRGVEGDVDGSWGARCLPVSGSCACTEANDGEARACSFENEHGACEGFQVCSYLTGWSPCDAGVPSEEICNGADDECDGQVDEELPETQPCTVDNAYGSCAGQAICVGALGWVCDAAEPSAELCDGVDNDCDGKIDEPGAAGCALRYPDADGDGFGGDAGAACLCGDDPAFPVARGGDCDDDDAAVNPGAQERCSGVDDDCDGLTDEGGAVGCVPHYRDGDGDGFAAAGGEGGESRCLCGPDGEWRAAALGDCDDDDPDRNPGAPERCGGEDEDCDGVFDEDGAEGCTPYYRDGDGDGFGQDADARCLCAPAAPYTMLTGGDCNDQLAAVNPDAPERCNVFDDDCDGQTDEGAEDCLVFYRDEDGDGFGVDDNQCLCLPAAPFAAVAAGDCDDESGAVSPVAAERCNGIDDDCDGQTDAALDLPDCTPYYRDDDGDGFGVAGDSLCACVPQGVYSAPAGDDCDDSLGAVNPEAADTCNGVDDDCDGETDEEAGDRDGDGISDCVDVCPIYVDTAAPVGGADGSPDAPFAVVGAGLAAADERGCAEVWVSAGTYEETLDFAGRDVLLRAVDGPESTVIDADGAGSVVTFSAEEGPGAGLVGFTLTGGTGTPGAGLWGDPALTYGGGVFVRGAAPTIRDCVVNGNVVSGLGGGLFLYESTARVEGGAVTGNTSTRAGDAGAGVALHGGRAQVLGVDIRGNQATGAGGAGGGVLLLSTAGSVRYNLIALNEAAEGAGIRVSEFGTAIIDSNVIADNLGEGVSFHHYSSTKFVGNTVVGNEGHGLRLTLCCGSLYAVPLIKNVAVAYNDGHGLHTDHNVDFGLFFSDLWGNGDGNYGGTMGSLYNPSLGITANDCLFRSFSANGDPDDDDLRLRANSPCIDSGGDVTLYFVTRDWDGNPRPVIGSDAPFAQYDRGAFEYQQ